MRKDTLVLRMLMCAVIASAALGCREHRTPPAGGGGTGGPDPMRAGGSRGGGRLRDGSTTGGTGGGAGTGGSGGNPASDAPGQRRHHRRGRAGHGRPRRAHHLRPGCGMGEVCVNGQCVSPCLPGQTNCPSGCSDLPTDPANCGMCGKACPAGQFCCAASA